MSRNPVSQEGGITNPRRPPACRFVTGVSPAVSDPVEAAARTIWDDLAIDFGTGDFAGNLPGQAAQLRQALASGTSAIPPDAAARLWRSLCGEVMAARGLKAVYLAGGETAQMIEAARGYFGFAVPLTLLGDVREALDRVEDTPGALACVPWPEIAGAGQWWPMLNEGRFRELSIIAGWPQIPGEADPMPKVAIVGKAQPSSSGNDDTFATAHDDTFVADGILARAGLQAAVVARARSLALIRIRGFAPNDDPRLDMARQGGLDGLRVIGGLPLA